MSFIFNIGVVVKKEREVSIEKRYRLLLIFTTSYLNIPLHLHLRK